MKKEKIIKEINFYISTNVDETKIFEKRFNKNIKNEIEELTKCENIIELIKRLKEITDYIKNINNQKKETLKDRIILKEIINVLKGEKNE